MFADRVDKAEFDDVLTAPSALAGENNQVPRLVTAKR